jgi:hypothetical protein
MERRLCIRPIQANFDEQGDPQAYRLRSAGATFPCPSVVFFVSPLLLLPLDYRADEVIQLYPDFFPALFPL